MPPKTKKTAPKGKQGAPVRDPGRKKKPTKPTNKNTRKLMKGVEA